MPGKNNNSRKPTSLMHKVITVLCVAVILFGGAYLCYEITMDMRISQVTDSVRDLYYQSATASAEEAVTEPEPTVEPVLNARFEEVIEMNADTVGWIEVNPEITYPIVWRDNSFYMDHDFNGEYNEAGWIFLDERNDIYMTDDNMLIYGHNMRNGTMFGELDRYREIDYLKENPLIKIQSAWEEEARNYVLISLFDASMNKSDPSYIKITNFNFELDEDKQAFVDSLCERSVYDLPFDATAEDQLIILVTCEYTHKNGRYLLVARELRDDETVEQVQEAFLEVK